MFEFESVIKAMLLLILSVSGNFLAETLGCQTQHILKKMYIKHILLFSMIYFTINFTKRHNENIHPNLIIGKSLIVWVLFHLYSHLDIIPSILSILLIMIIYYLSNYRDYLHNKKEKDTHLDDKLKFYQKILMGALLTTIIVGFLIYLIEKKIEYKSKFDIKKFLFGVKKCKGYTPKTAKFFK